MGWQTHKSKKRKALLETNKKSKVLNLLKKRYDRSTKKKGTNREKKRYNSNTELFDGTPRRGDKQQIGSTRRGPKDLQQGYKTSRGPDRYIIADRGENKKKKKSTHRRHTARSVEKNRCKTCVET